MALPPLLGPEPLPLVRVTELPVPLVRGAAKAVLIEPIDGERRE